MTSSWGEKTYSNDSFLFGESEIISLTESERTSDKLVECFSIRRKISPLSPLAFSKTMFFIDRFSLRRLRNMRGKLIARLVTWENVPRDKMKTAIKFPEDFTRFMKIVFHLATLIKQFSSLPSYRWIRGKCECTKSDKGWWNRFSSPESSAAFSCVQVAENVTVLPSTLFSPL